MSKTQDAVKLSDKAKELKMTVKDLISVLSEAGYDYTSGTATLKADALQYLAIEHSNEVSSLEDAMENVVIVPVDGKFAIVHIMINSKMEVKELSRRIFESKVRAYFELGYQSELLETGR